MTSSAPSPSDRLKRNGRKPEPSFSAAELLYQRFSKLDWDGKEFKPSLIPFPNFSVNRELYSVPEDVLYPSWPKFGIRQFAVGDIPKSILASESGAESDFTFGVEHLPEEENYSHSEVWSYKAGIRAKKVKSENVKKLFRMKLTAKIRVVKPLDELE